MEGVERNSWVSGCSNWEDGVRLQRIKTSKTSQMGIMLRSMNNLQAV